jgi:hypothetical protein
MTIRSLRLFAAVSAALPLLFAASTSGQTTPTTLGYQGRLTDNSPEQTPLDGTANMTFELWDAQTGGSRLWVEPASGSIPVTVSKGIFSVLLGGNGVPVPASIFAGGTSRYLQMIVDGETLTPRHTIASVGYSHQSENSASADQALDGVVTTASYADPAWITSLSGSKISGSVPSATTAATATSATTAVLATNATQLGGVAASGYQRALATNPCPAGQFYSAISQNGTTVCGAPAGGGSETDPQVSSTATGRVPRWNGTTLTDGAMSDTGSAVGIGTVSPISQLHVAGSGPVAVGSTATGSTPRAVDVQGRYAYVVNETSNTLQVFDVSNPAGIGSAVGSVVAGGGPYALRVLGRYAYVADGSNKLQVYDVSNPASIGAAVGSIPAGQSGSVEVQGRFAFLTNFAGNSLDAYDISNPASPVAAGSLFVGVGPFSVEVEGRYAYVLFPNGAVLRVIDVANPASMAIVGGASTGTGPSAVRVQGRHAYVVNKSSNTLQLFDVSNPAAIGAAIGSVSTGSGPTAVEIQGRYAYVTTSNAEKLEVFDVSNPAAPIAIASAATGTGPFFVRVRGRHAFVVNSVANTLQAFDLGGAYVQQLEAGGIEAASLATRGDVRIDGGSEIRGGLEVGSGGIYSAGDVATSGRLKIAGGSPGAGRVLTSDAAGLATWEVNGVGTVTAVTVSAPLSVANGTTAPDISLSGVVPIGNGGTGSSTLNFVDLTSAQIVGGPKSFTSGITGNLDGNATNVTGVVAIANGGTGSVTQNFVDLSTPQTIGGSKTFTNPISGSGANLTSLNAGNIDAGTLALARGGSGTDLSATGGTGQFLKQITAGGAVTVGTISSSDVPSLDAAKITTGVLPIARGGTGSGAQNFVDLSTTQTIGGAKSFSSPISGSGANLTSLNAGNVASGTLALARGGTGSDLSGTGGGGQYLKQATAGGAVSVGTIPEADIPNLPGSKIAGPVASATTAATAANATQLGGVAASGWQKALVTNPCPAGQFYSGIGQDGSAVCSGAVTSEADPQIASTVTGRVPRWNGTSLVDGGVFDDGAGKVGIGTATPAAQLQVSGATLTKISSTSTGITTPKGLYVQGNYAYVSDTASGYHVFDISNPASPTLVNTIAGGGAATKSVTVSGPLLIAANNSFGAYDVSNPMAPTSFGSADTGFTPGPSSVAQVFADGASFFAVSTGNNYLLQYDRAGFGSGPPKFPISTGLSAPMWVHVNDGHAFVASRGNNSLVIFRIWNPFGLTHVGSISTGLNTPLNVYVQGRHAFVASQGNNSLVIFDVSNPATPTMVSATSTGLTSPEAVFVQGNRALVAGGNVLALFDVSNPAAPTLLASDTTNLVNARALHVQGRYAWVASEGNSSLVGYDLGGTFLNQLEAGGIDTGTLTTRSNAHIGGYLAAEGGVSAGTAGISTIGSIVASGKIEAQSTITAQSFAGSGSTLTALNASSFSTGTLALARGGTGANLSATGGLGQLLKQTAAGGAVTVGVLGASELPTHTHAATDITSANLAVARMPIGGAWALSSPLSVDSNTLVVDPTNNRVGIGTAPAEPLDVAGNATVSGRLLVGTEAGAATPVGIGERYRDNGIIAWAKVTAAGALTTEFGIASITKPAVGSYQITIDAVPSSLNALIPMATAEIDSQPTSAANVRIVSVNQSTQTTFFVYVNSGTFAAVDNDFVFMVTGR